MRNRLFEDASNPMDSRDYVSTAQFRELYTKLGNLEESVGSLEAQVNETLLTEGPTVDTATPMTNFVDNSDFTLSHYAYSFASDITTNFILAKWYARTQSSTGVFYINTTDTESPVSVRSVEGNGETIAYTSIATNTISLDNDPSVLFNGMPVTITGSSLSSSTVYYVINATTASIQLASTYNSTTPVTVTAAAGGNIVTAFDPYAGSRSVIWDIDTATLATSGGYLVASPLATRYAFLGNQIYVKMTLAHKPREFASTSITRSSNTFTCTGHGLAQTTAVYFVKNTSSSSLPAPLVEDTTYYIKSVTTDTYQLSTVEDGTTTVTITSDGSDYTMKTRVKAGLTARISIFENAGGEVFKNDKPVLTTSKIGSHSGGTATRKYILEVQLPNGRRFYSDVSSPHTVTNTVSTSSVDNDDYVTISWDKIVGVSRYNLYRTEGTGNPWYLVGTTNSSGNILFDFGGGTSVFVPPASLASLPVTYPQTEYMRAEAVIENATDAVSAGELVNVELNSSILFPSAVTGFAAKGDQFVQVEFFKANGQATDLADIPKNSLLIDRVSMSYVYGRWHPSSRDQALTPTKLIPTNPLPSGGGGDGTSGGGVITGGGGTTDTGDGTQCVHVNTPILMWQDSGEHVWIPAKDVVIGDRLVAWDGEKLAPSRVMRITNGISKMNYRIYADDKELVCSFSHRVIQDMGDFSTGTNAGRLDKTAVVYDNGSVKVAEIQGIESFSGPMSVVTFRMEKGLENYISAGLFSHNRKTEYEFPIIV